MKALSENGRFVFGEDWAAFLPNLTMHASSKQRNRYSRRMRRSGFEHIRAMGERNVRWH